MSISVCLPTYNGARFLPAAIDSVLRQQNVDFELLIRDDCSSDETVEICRSFAAVDSRVKFAVNPARLGLFGNYNRCFADAVGELIKPMAQDDELLECDALLRLSRPFKDNPDINLVACRRAVGDAYASAGGNQVLESLPAGRIDGRAVILRCLSSYRNLIGEPVAVMLRGGQGSGDLEGPEPARFDESYSSLGDLDLWLRILLHGDLFVVDSELVRFRQHGDSATMSLLRNMDWVLDFFTLARRFAPHLDEIGLNYDEYCMGFIDFAGALIDSLVREGRLEVDELSGYRETTYYSMRRCAQLAFKSREYDAVVKSTSWKITQPLRALMRTLGR